MNSREQIQKLISEALTTRQVESLLNSALDEVFERVDADPELRREIIRESLRSAIFTNFWRM